METADEEVQRYVAALLKDDELVVKQMVESHSSRYRFTLAALALFHKLGFLRKPPHIGKFLNVIEIVWAIVKGSARKQPKVERGDDDAMISLLGKELSKMCDRPRVLMNLCLPSMRFCFAVLKATFHGECLVHKKKQILFAELFKALNDFGLDLRKGEANEDSDKGAITEPVDIEEPPSLREAMLPMKVESIGVRTAEGLAELQAAHKRSLDAALADRPKRRRTIDTSRGKNLGDLEVGDWVYYQGQTKNKFVNAFVMGHNANGTIHLDVKPEANPAFVAIPSLRTPAHVRAEVAKAKAEMQAKKAAEKAAAKAAQGAVPDEEGEVHTPADAPDVDLEFAGARVIRWDWDPEGPCWEVLLDRDCEVLTRMVWPKD